MAPIRGPGTGPRGSTGGGIRGAAMGRGDYGKYKGKRGLLNN